MTVCSYPDSGANPAGQGWDGKASGQTLTPPFTVCPGLL